MPASDYTQFRFPTLGLNAILKVDGVVAVANTWYNQGQTVTVEKSDPADFGSPYDFITYQTTDGTNISNVATIRVNARPNLTLDPLSADTNSDVNNSDVINVGDNLPINDGVDRVLITDFTGNGQLMFQGRKVSKNTLIMRYELSDLTLEIGSEGLGSPYEVIEYEVGNEDGVDKPTYTDTYNVLGVTSLELVAETDGVITGPPNIHGKQADLRISDGFVGLTANLTFQFNITNGTPFPTGTDNVIILNVGQQEYEIQDGNLYNISVDINSLGYSNIFLQMGIEETDLPVQGTLDFVLVDIDGDTNKVSNTNNSVSLLVDFQI